MLPVSFKITILCLTALFVSYPFLKDVPTMKDGPLKSIVALIAVFLAFLGLSAFCYGVIVDL